MLGTAWVPQQSSRSLKRVRGNLSFYLLFYFAPFLFLCERSLMQAQQEEHWWFCTQDVMQCFFAADHITLPSRAGLLGGLEEVFLLLSDQSCGSKEQCVLNPFCSPEQQSTSHLHKCGLSPKANWTFSLGFAACWICVYFISAQLIRACLSELFVCGKQ